MDAEPETAPLPAGWNAIANALDVGWGGEFDDYDAWGYHGFLKDFDPAYVLKAVQNLGLSGRTFYPRPKVTDIAAELRRLLGTDGPAHEFDAPSFSEIQRVVCNEAWEPSKRLAVEIVADKCGPVAEAWFAAGAREMIRSLALGDDPGGFKIKQVGKSYEDFVGVQRERVARGLTPVVAIDGQVTRGGLRRLDPLKALTS